MKYYFIILLFLSVINSNAQSKMAFKSGEWFKYKLSYSGWFKAGEATVNLIEDINNNELLHAKMIGKTTGPINLFFKVYDRYESFFYKDKILPNKFVRNIYEGGYTKNIEILFNQKSKTAKVKDYKKNSSEIFSLKNKSQDMVSVFYYLSYSWNELKYQ